MKKATVVQYVDFGFVSVAEYWAEIVVPAYEGFKAEPNRANAINASVSAWHVHDWIWHDEHPGEDTDGNPDYKQFLTKILNDCPQLRWIRDVANAGKHRGLGRSPTPVRRVASETRFVGSFNTLFNTMPFNSGHSVKTPLMITLTDGRAHGFVEVLSFVIDYWRTNYFP